MHVRAFGATNPRRCFRVRLQRNIYHVHSYDRTCTGKCSTFMKICTRSFHTRTLRQARQNMQRFSCTAGAGRFERACPIDNFIDKALVSSPSVARPKIAVYNYRWMVQRLCAFAVDGFL